MRSHCLTLTLAAALAPASASAGSFSDHRLGEFYPVEDVDEEVVAGVSDAVVYFGGATGFFIDPRGYILTNDHVRESFGRSGTVHRRWTADGAAASLRVDLVFADAGHDVAVYEVRGRAGDFPAIPISSRHPTIGEEVFVIGHPHSRTQRVSFGTVLADDLRLSGRPSIEYSAQTWWGSSGSPVVDRNGRAIAIHWGWDEHGESNGRLTGVPFHVLGQLEDLRPYLPDANSDPAPRSEPRRHCLDAGAWSLHTELVESGASANGEGRALDHLRVHAVGPAGCEVTGVGFELHPTFSEPWQWSDGLQPLTLRAWGRFDAGAWVVLDDGEVVGFRDRITW